MRDTYILGIHGFSSKSKKSMHNSGVCILKNGKIIAAIDEERYTRKKNEGAFPVKALKDVFKLANIKPEDITYISMPDKKPLWQFKKITKYAVKTFLETGIFMNNYLKENYRSKDLKRDVPNNLVHAKKIFVEHHLAHASSAYHTCPWHDATIITIDGMGDFSMSGITAVGCNGKISVLNRLNGFYSPGLFYMIITEILGFVSGRHEGKVTGLAAYGKYNEELKKIFDIFISYDTKKSDFFSKHVAYEINDYISKKWVNGFNPSIGTDSFDEKEYLAQKEKQLLSFREPLKGYSKEDIAFAAQNRLEEVVLEHVINTISRTKIRNVVLAGGVFSNVKLNQKINELSCVDNLYIFPAMNDSGLSVGSALYVHYVTLKNNFKPKPFKSVYLGRRYSDVEIEKILVEKKVDYSYYDNIAIEIAKYLKKGKVIAHFNGKMEYGPRALGNRSILASAIDENINTTLNKKLKRTEFMPFAPATIIDQAEELYYNIKADNIPSRFMTMTFNVKEKLKRQSPATVHIDNTARPQLVSYKDNPRFYNIINEYYRLTGIPTIINTSFNIHEEPIVNTPKEALKIL